MADSRSSFPTRSQADIAVRLPDVDVNHEGYTVLVTRMDGRIGLDPLEGVFDFDTRILSWWRLRIDGCEPELVSSTRTDKRNWGGLLRVVRGGGTAAGPRLPQDAIGIDIRRRPGCGMVEQIRLHNHSMAAARLEVELELGADFADIQEVKQQERRQAGDIRTRWEPDLRTLTTQYVATVGGHRLERGVRVTVEGVDGPIRRTVSWPRGRRPRAPWTGERVSRLSLTVRLEPHGSTTIHVRYESLVDGMWRRPRTRVDERSRRDEAHASWQARRAAIESGHPVVDPLVDVAAEDLWDLRNWDLDGDADDSWLMNAGVPMYTGVFGRDSLLAGIQALLFGPEPLDGALRVVAATQGQRDDPWTEEQPGRMIHEIRRGALSDLRIVPQHRFYGAHTTSTLFPIALAAHWRWVGDLETVRRHLPVVLRALDWAANLGDLDGDGFLEYRQRSPQGLKNEAWKDSREAIRYPDGQLVRNPVATVEEQAFHIAALEATTDLLEVVGDHAQASRLAARARDLRARWHEAYWEPEIGTYALALDPDKRRVATITSNPGHGLAMGVVPREHARAVVERMMAPDMFSGWGIRTLSSAHPSYNPFAYHLGSVWPFENAMFVAGLRRYGFDDEAEQLTTALIRAAGHFEAVRLPELFGGHGPDELPFPTVYPDSNIPQAWTASAIGLLMTSVLGLEPSAPDRCLRVVRPRLPSWLPMLTLRRLRVGAASVDLRFERDAGGTTRHTVLDVRGDLDIARVDDANTEYRAA